MRGFVMPAGHSMIAGTRRPPSYILPLKSRKPPVVLGCKPGKPPLSLVNHTSVFRATFKSRSPLRNVPMLRSIATNSP